MEAKECRLLDENSHSEKLSEIFGLMEGFDFGVHGEIEEVDVLTGRIQLRWLYPDNESWCLALIDPDTTFEGPHPHPKQTEIIYVISGHMLLWISGQGEKEYGPGDIVEIPPGIPHWVKRYWVKDGEPIIQVGRLFPRTGNGINGYAR